MYLSVLLTYGSPGLPLSLKFIYIYIVMNDPLQQLVGGGHILRVGGRFMVFHAKPNLVLFYLATRVLIDLPHRRPIHYIGRDDWTHGYLI